MTTDNQSSSGIETLPNGQWVLEHDSHVSKWARQWGTIKCDPMLFAVMLPWLKDVEVVWDIGACIGDHTRFYLDNGKKVVAVEPNPLAFKCLAHNCPEATLLNVAASDAPGVLRFITTENAGASRIVPDGPMEVSAVRMDDLDLPAPQFVKIDVEGWEHEAIAGMKNTLLANHPLMFIEINAGALAANGRNHDGIVTLLKSLGYTNFRIHPAYANWGDEQFDIFVSL